MVEKARPSNAQGASMGKHEMGPAERKDLDAINRVFAKFFNGIRVSDSPDGPQSERRNKYLYWETADQWMFCYTPWKDDDGWYYAFTYKPFGKGSRSGDPSQWRLIDKVRFRKRRSAEARTVKRYIKRTKMLRDK